MTNDKLLGLSAYVFGIPALYIALSEWRKDKFMSYHGTQALVFWTKLFLLFFGARFLVNLIWSIYYIPHLEKLEFLVGAGMWGYVVYHGYQDLH